MPFRDTDTVSWVRVGVGDEQPLSLVSMVVADYGDDEVVVLGGGIAEDEAIDGVGCSAEVK